MDGLGVTVEIILVSRVRSVIILGGSHPCKVLHVPGYPPVSRCLLLLFDAETPSTQEQYCNNRNGRVKDVETNKQTNIQTGKKKPQKTNSRSGVL